MSDTLVYNGIYTLYMCDSSMTSNQKGFYVWVLWCGVKTHIVRGRNTLSSALKLVSAEQDAEYW